MKTKLSSKLWILVWDSWWNSNFCRTVKWIKMTYAPRGNPHPRVLQETWLWLSSRRCHLTAWGRKLNFLPLNILVLLLRSALVSNQPCKSDGVKAWWWQLLSLSRNKIGVRLLVVMSRVTVFVNRCAKLPYPRQMVIIRFISTSQFFSHCAENMEEREE